MRFTIEIDAKGCFTEEEIKDYIIHQIGIGGISADNAFISDEGDAEIISAEII